ncbi:hypothetical protein ACVWXQ_006708 [Bradyrhizobium sp. S3.14.4]
MLDGPEQERHGEHVHRRDEVADQRHIGPVKVDRADPGLLDGLLLFAELTGMEHLDLVPAAGALGNQRAHVAQRLDGRVILGLGVGGAEFARSCARRADREQKRDEDQPGPREFGTVQHWHTQPLSGGVYGEAKRFNAI